MAGYPGRVRLDALHAVLPGGDLEHHPDERADLGAVLRRLDAPRPEADLSAPGPGPLVSLLASFCFAAKTFFVFFMNAMVRSVVPRYRYDQLMRLGWKVFLPTSLVAVALVAGWRVYAPGCDEGSLAMAMTVLALGLAACETAARTRPGRPTTTREAARPTTARPRAATGPQGPSGDPAAIDALRLQEEPRCSSVSDRRSRARR